MSKYSVYIIAKLEVQVGAYSEERANEIARMSVLGAINEFNMLHSQEPQIEIDEVGDVFTERISDD